MRIYRMWIKIVSEKGKQQSPRAQFRVRPCNPCATSPTKILVGVSLPFTFRAISLRISLVRYIRLNSVG